MRTSGLKYRSVRMSASGAQSGNRKYKSAQSISAFGGTGGYETWIVLLPYSAWRIGASRAKFGMGTCEGKAA